MVRLASIRAANEEPQEVVQPREGLHQDTGGTLEAQEANLVSSYEEALQLAARGEQSKAIAQLEHLLGHPLFEPITRVLEDAAEDMPFQPEAAMTKALWTEQPSGLKASLSQLYTMILRNLAGLLPPGREADAARLYCLAILQQGEHATDAMLWGRLGQSAAKAGQLGLARYAIEQGLQHASLGRLPLYEHAMEVAWVGGDYQGALDVARQLLTVDTNHQTARHLQQAQQQAHAHDTLRRMLGCAPGLNTAASAAPDLLHIVQQQLCQALMQGVVKTDAPADAFFPDLDATTPAATYPAAPPGQRLLPSTWTLPAVSGMDEQGYGRAAPLLMVPGGKTVEQLLCCLLQALLVDVAVYGVTGGDADHAVIRHVHGHLVVVCMEAWGDVAAHQPCATQERPRAEGVGCDSGAAHVVTGKSDAMNDRTGGSQHAPRSPQVDVQSQELTQQAQLVEAAAVLHKVSTTPSPPPDAVASQTTPEPQLRGVNGTELLGGDVPGSVGGGMSDKENHCGDGRVVGNGVGHGAGVEGLGALRSPTTRMQGKRKLMLDGTGPVGGRGAGAGVQSDGDVTREIGRSVRARLNAPAAGRAGGIAAAGGGEGDAAVMVVAGVGGVTGTGVLGAGGDDGIGTRSAVGVKLQGSAAVFGSLRGLLPAKPGQGGGKLAGGVGLSQEPPGGSQAGLASQVARVGVSDKHGSVGQHAVWQGLLKDTPGITVMAGPVLSSPQLHTKWQMRINDGGAQELVLEAGGSACVLASGSAPVPLSELCFSVLQVLLRQLDQLTPSCVPLLLALHAQLWRQCSLPPKQLLNLAQLHVARAAALQQAAIAAGAADKPASKPQVPVAKAGAGPKAGRVRGGRGGGGGGAIAAVAGGADAVAGQDDQEPTGPSSWPEAVEQLVTSSWGVAEHLRAAERLTSQVQAMMLMGGPRVTRAQVATDGMRGHAKPAGADDGVGCGDGRVHDLGGGEGGRLEGEESAYLMDVDVAGQDEHELLNTNGDGEEDGSPGMHAKRALLHLHWVWAHIADLKGSVADALRMYRSCGAMLSALPADPALPTPHGLPAITLPAIAGKLRSLQLLQLLADAEDSDHAAHHLPPATMQRLMALAFPDVPPALRQALATTPSPSSVTDVPATSDLSPMDDSQQLYTAHTDQELPLSQPDVQNTTLDTLDTTLDTDIFQSMPVDEALRNRALEVLLVSSARAGNDNSTMRVLHLCCRAAQSIPILASAVQSVQHCPPPTATSHPALVKLLSMSDHVSALLELFTEHADKNSGATSAIAATNATDVLVFHGNGPAGSRLHVGHMLLAHVCMQLQHQLLDYLQSVHTWSPPAPSSDGPPVHRQVQPLITRSHALLLDGMRLLELMMDAPWQHHHHHQQQQQQQQQAGDTGVGSATQWAGVEDVVVEGPLPDALEHQPAMLLFWSRMLEMLGSRFAPAEMQGPLKTGYRVLVSAIQRVVEVVGGPEKAADILYGKADVADESSDEEMEREREREGGTGGETDKDVATQGPAVDVGAPDAVVVMGSQGMEMDRTVEGQKETAGEGQDEGQGQQGGGGGGGDVSAALAAHVKAVYGAAGQVLMLLTGVRVDWRNASFGNVHGTNRLAAPAAVPDINSFEQVVQLWELMAPLCHALSGKQAAKLRTLFDRMRRQTPPVPPSVLSSSHARHFLDDPSLSDHLLALGTALPPAGLCNRVDTAAADQAPDVGNGAVVPPVVIDIADKAITTAGPDRTATNNAAAAGVQLGGGGSVVRGDGGDAAVVVVPGDEGRVGAGAGAEGDRSVVLDEMTKSLHSGLHFLVAEAIDPVGTLKEYGLNGSGHTKVEEAADLLLSDLAMNPSRLETWKRLAELYSTACRFLLDSAADEMSPLAWQSTEREQLRGYLQHYLRRAIRAHSVCLAAEGQDENQRGLWYEAMGVLYLNTVQRCTPLGDALPPSTKPPRDSHWATRCCTAYLLYNRALECIDGEWTFPWMMGKLPGRLRGAWKAALQAVRDGMAAPALGSDNSRQAAAGPTRKATTAMVAGAAVAADDVVMAGAGHGAVPVEGSIPTVVLLPADEVVGMDVDVAAVQGVQGVHRRDSVDAEVAQGCVEAVDWVEDMLCCYARACRLALSARGGGLIDPWYRLHAARLKLVLECREWFGLGQVQADINTQGAQSTGGEGGWAYHMGVMQHVAAFCFSTGVDEQLVRYQGVMDGDCATLSEAERQEQAVGMTTVLLEDCCAAMRWCASSFKSIASGGGQYHRAHYQLSKVWYHQGKYQQVLDELKGLVGPSLSGRRGGGKPRPFDIQSQPIQSQLFKGTGGAKGRHMRAQHTRARAHARAHAIDTITPQAAAQEPIMLVGIGEDEEARDWAAAVRRMVKLYLQASAAAGDIERLDHAAVFLAGDRSWGPMLEDLAKAARGLWVACVSAQLNEFVNSTVSGQTNDNPIALQAAMTMYLEHVVDKLGTTGAAGGLGSTIKVAQEQACAPGVVALLRGVPLTPHVESLREDSLDLCAVAHVKLLEASNQLEPLQILTKHVRKRALKMANAPRQQTAPFLVIVAEALTNVSVGEFKSGVQQLLTAHKQALANEAAATAEAAAAAHAAAVAGEKAAMAAADDTGAAEVPVQGIQGEDGAELPSQTLVIDPEVDDSTRMVAEVDQGDATDEGGVMRTTRHRSASVEANAMHASDTEGQGGGVERQAAQLPITAPAVRSTRNRQQQQQQIVEALTAVAPAPPGAPAATGVSAGSCAQELVMALKAAISPLSACLGLQPWRLAASNASQQQALEAHLLRAWAWFGQVVHGQDAGGNAYWRGLQAALAAAPSQVGKVSEMLSACDNLPTRVTAAIVSPPPPAPPTQPPTQPSATLPAAAGRGRTTDMSADAGTTTMPAGTSTMPAGIEVPSINSQAVQTSGLNPVPQSQSLHANLMAMLTLLLAQPQPVNLQMAQSLSVLLAQSGIPVPDTLPQLLQQPATSKPALQAMLVAVLAPQQAAGAAVQSAASSSGAHALVQALASPPARVQLPLPHLTRLPAPAIQPQQQQQRQQQQPPMLQSVPGTHQQARALGSQAGQQVVPVGSPVITRIIPRNAASQVLPHVVQQAPPVHASAVTSVQQRAALSSMITSQQRHSPPDSIPEAMQAEVARLVQQHGMEEATRRIMLQCNSATMKQQMSQLLVRIAMQSSQQRQTSTAAVGPVATHQQRQPAANVQGPAVAQHAQGYTVQRPPRTNITAPNIITTASTLPVTLLPSTSQAHTPSHDIMPKMHTLTPLYTPNTSVLSTLPHTTLTSNTQSHTPPRAQHPPAHTASPDVHKPAQLTQSAPGPSPPGASSPDGYTNGTAMQAESLQTVAGPSTAVHVTPTGLQGETEQIPWTAAIPAPAPSTTVAPAAPTKGSSGTPPGVQGIPVSCLPFPLFTPTNKQNHQNRSAPTS